MSTLSALFAGHIMLRDASTHRIVLYGVPTSNSIVSMHPRRQGSGFTVVLLFTLMPDDVTYTCMVTECFVISMRSSVTATLSTAARFDRFQYAGEHHRRGRETMRTERP